MSTPARQHVVSAGYQRNFATHDQRLVIVTAATGELVTTRRAVRRNWTGEHWYSVMDPVTGEPDTQLEEAFSQLETHVLHQIRSVRIGHLTDEAAGAVCNLFAIHLARSFALRAAQLRIYDEEMPGLIAEMSASADVLKLFERDYGRPPVPGEIEGIAQERADYHNNTGAWRIESTAEQHNNFGERLASMRIQIIEVDDRLPGLVLGDVPVVHADVGTGRFGFRDRLAFGDADLIIGPLTRRIAVCFSTRPEKHVRVTTKKLLNQIAGVFVRAAINELACHPDDALNLQRVCRNRPLLRGQP